MTESSGKKWTLKSKVSSSWIFPESACSMISPLWSIAFFLFWWNLSFLEKPSATEYAWLWSLEFHESPSLCTFTAGFLDMFGSPLEFPVMLGMLGLWVNPQKGPQGSCWGYGWPRKTAPVNSLQGDQKVVSATAQSFRFKGFWGGAGGSAQGLHLIKPTRKPGKLQETHMFKCGKHG